MSPVLRHVILASSYPFTALDDRAFRSNSPIARGILRGGRNVMRIENSEFDIAPIDDPLVYPGRIPEYSFLYHKEHLYRLDVTEGRRVGKARIVWPEARAKEITGGPKRSLDNCLLHLNATSSDWRYISWPAARMRARPSCGASSQATEEAPLSR